MIALLCAGLSVLVGCGVGLRWHARTLLWAAIVLNLVYWVVGQAFGGVATGEATDINSAPLFILLAGAMFTLFRRPARSASAGRPVLSFGSAAHASGEVPSAGGRVMHSRRSVLQTAGVVTGLAAAAVIADLAGVFGRGGGTPPPGTGSPARQPHPASPIRHDGR